MNVLRLHSIVIRNYIHTVVLRNEMRVVFKSKCSFRALVFPNHNMVHGEVIRADLLVPCRLLLPSD